MTESSDPKFAESVAYPTIGVILLGGVSDKVNRNPLHTSAGFAYTGFESDIYVRTRVYAGHGIPSGSINGELIPYTESSRSPFHILNKYHDIVSSELGLDGQDFSLSFESANKGVLSGSSDAGAAAIGADIVSLTRNRVGIKDLEAELRSISESVGRSIYGGLTVTWVQNGEIKTERVLEADAFRDYVVMGCGFNVTRNPSDKIHENIVKSPEYERRRENTFLKANKLAKMADDGDIEGIFDLALEDTEEYHRLIESVGVKVITPEMRRLIDSANQIRKDTWLSYIVTGGSNVFIVTRKKDMKEVRERIEGLWDTLTALKIAGEARVVSHAL